MKQTKRLHLLSVLAVLFCCSIQFSSLQAQIFVDQDATGTNDGSSWTNAFTELSPALAMAGPQDFIWVAKGTYLPDTVSSAHFLISQDIQLYGGFNGTETLLSERDPSLYATILSGDLLGNDSTGNFQINRTDNSNSVLIITTAVTSACVINGFTIQNGHADSVGVAVGGAIRCEGSPTISNCLFTENYATDFGGAIYLIGSGASGLTLDNCLFINNHCDDRGGAINILNAIAASDTVLITDCFFSGNKALLGGGGIRLRSSDLIVTNTRFEGNEAEVIGGGMVIFQTQNVRYTEIVDCEFLNNRSGDLAGGLFFETENALGASYQISGCVFDGNYAQESGGAIMIFTDANNGNSASGQILNNIFTNNRTIGRGAAIRFAFGGANSSALVDSCLFQFNQTGDSLRGGFAIYANSFNQRGTLTITDSEFFANRGTDGGSLGILTENQGEWNAMIQGCDFIQNESVLSTAAIGSSSIFGSINTSIHIDQCRFEENRVTGAADSLQNTFGAGTVTFGSNTPAYQASITRSEFTRNQFPGGSAAFGFYDFNMNSQALNSSLTMESCLFTEHDSSAAVMSFENFFPGSPNLIEATLTNLTFADNNMPAIQSKDSMLVILRNSILHSPNHPDLVLSAGVGFTSEGGNLISDSSAISILAAGDLYGIDPMFSGEGPTPYQLAFGSPAVDLGLPFPGLEMTDKDLAGNDRIQGLTIDAGAYESPFTTSIGRRIPLTTGLTTYPNPIDREVYVELSNDMTGDISVELYSLTGQLIQQYQVTKQQPEETWTLTVPKMISGFYQLVVSDGMTSVQTRILKR